MQAVPKVQICIMASNRVHFLGESLRSVLDAAIGSVEVFISDNSTNHEVQKFLAENFPTVRCIYRQPHLSPIEHLVRIFSELTAQYVVVFHDDDVMRHDFISTLKHYLDVHPNCIAVACNALVIRSETKSSTPYMGRFNQTVEISSSHELLKHYAELVDVGPAPFPSYMYRREALVGLQLDDAEGGKYSDVALLLKIAQRGVIAWLPDTLMHYRIHPGGGGISESIGHRLRLLRFIQTFCGLSRYDKPLREYRFRIYTRWVSSIFLERRNSIRRRHLVAIKFLLSYSYSVVLNIVFWKRLGRRLISFS
jgi:glycosyltransferase involved in cell wall biosynthesis